MRMQVILRECVAAIGEKKEASTVFTGLEKGRSQSSYSQQRASCLFFLQAASLHKHF